MGRIMEESGGRVKREGEENGGQKKGCQDEPGSLSGPRSEVRQRLTAWMALRTFSGVKGNSLRRAPVAL